MTINVNIFSFVVTCETQVYFNFYWPLSSKNRFTPIDNVFWHRDFSQCQKRYLTHKFSEIYNRIFYNNIARTGKDFYKLIISPLLTV